MKPMYAIHWLGVQAVEVTGVYTSLPLAALHALRHLRDRPTVTFDKHRPVVLMESNVMGLINIPPASRMTKDPMPDVVVNPVEEFFGRGGR